MNSIIDAALRYNRAVLLTLILLLGAGGLTYNQLPKEATPDIKLPFLYVSASLKGISPEDSLDQLLEPLESEIQGLEGLKSMDSTAYQGGANLTLEFEAGWDVERAKDDVQEAVDAAKQNLPGEADDPNVTIFKDRPMALRTRKPIMNDPGIATATKKALRRPRMPSTTIMTKRIAKAVLLIRSPSN